MGGRYDKIFALIAFLTQITAVWYFLTSLKTFKKGLKIAYRLAAIGILIFSLLQVRAFMNIDSIVSGLFILVPYTLGALLIYFGMRKFTKLLEIRSRWASFPFAFLISCIMAALSTQLPHAADSFLPPETTVDIVIGLATWCATMSFSALMLILRIQRAIGPTYKKAMWWLATAEAVLIFTVLHEIAKSLYFYTSAYSNNFLWWTFVLTGIIFLRAGMAFQETGRQVLQVPASPSYVDIVIGAAQLASSPRAIETTLDKVRAITATSDPQNGLSPKDKATMLNVYLSIEQYLITKEPLQAFTVDGLRSNLPEDFLRALPPSGSAA